MSFSGCVSSGGAFVVVIGTGIDSIQIKEFSILLERGERYFVNRCFSTRELSAAGSGYNRLRRLACGFAAKEAVLKALGTGWSEGISWKDVEILGVLPQSPVVTLKGAARNVAQGLGGTTLLLSVSATRYVAVACVLLISEQEDAPD